MDATRKRKNKTMAEKLYAEILDLHKIKDLQLKKEILIKWLSQIKHLRILDGKKLWLSIL